MSNKYQMGSATSGDRKHGRCSVQNHRQCTRGRSKFKTLITTAVLTMALMLVFQTSPVCATNCEPSDYRHIVGSEVVSFNDLQVAPNSNNDLLIAGAYIESSADPYLYVYLFSESTCSYRWRFGSKVLQSVAGLAWNSDESKAYMLTETKAILTGPYEQLDIFNAPYSKSASVTSYQMPVSHVMGSPLINDGSFFVLHQAQSSLQSFLIVRDANVAKFIVGNSFQNCYQTEMQAMIVNLHAVVNTHLEASFILALNPNTMKYVLTKQSLSSYSNSGEAQQFTYRVVWDLNGNFLKIQGGRVALYYNQDESSTQETAFIAASQNLEVRNLQGNFLELYQMRFDSNALECSNGGCNNFKIKQGWSKVLAISAQSATSCFVLAARYEFGVEIYLYDVDFTEGIYTTLIQDTTFQKFVDNEFDSFSPYEYQSLQARPYYSSSGDLLDFYLTVSLKGLPEASDFFFKEEYWEEFQENVDISGDLGVILTVLNDRVNDFFKDDGETEFGQQNIFDPLEKAPSEYEFQVTKYYLNKIYDINNLGHFNGQMSTAITYHENVMQSQRQVKLNNAPWLVPPLSYDVTYNVGQALWTTFPVFFDEEENYNDEGYFDLVDVSYINNTIIGLPKASEFYSLLPHLNSIRSKTYTAAMAGKHTLHVIIADVFDARSSFNLKVTVNATVNTRPVLDQQPLGNQALLSDDDDAAWEETEEFIEQRQEKKEEALDECLHSLRRLRRLAPDPPDDTEDDKDDNEDQTDDNHELEGPSGSGDNKNHSNGPPGQNEHGGPGGPGQDLLRECLKQLIFFSEDNDDDEPDQQDEESDENQDQDGKFFENDFVFDASKFGASTKYLIPEIDILSAEIDRNGILTLTFASDVSFLKDLHLNSDDTDSNGRSLRKEDDKYDNLKDKKYQGQEGGKPPGSPPLQKFDLKDLIKFELLYDASEDNAQNYDFTWEVISIEPYKVVIQIIWKDPSHISKDGIKDEIQIVINTKILGDKFNHKEPEVFSLLVPKQNLQNEVEVVEDNSAAQASVAQLGVAGFQLARFLLVGALSQLWGLINGLSLFVHLPLLGVDLPSHTLELLNFLIEIAQFDVFENEFVYGGLVPFETEDEGLMEKYQYFVDTGYQSSYAFVNMGTNVIIITILFIFMLLLVCLMRWRESSNLVGRFHKKCSGIIFWNFWLRMLIQGCLEIGIGAYLYCIERQTLIDLSPNGYGAFFFINDLLSISFMIILHAMPIFIIIFYCKNFSKMSDKKFADKWGSTYDGLRTDRRSIIFFPVIFLVRRIIFMQLAFFLKNQETGQMYSVIFINMILLMNIGIVIYLMLYKPFSSQLLQGLEMFNEITSFVLTYISMCLTGEFVAEPEARDNIGYSFNAVMGVNITVHIYFMIRSSYRDCKKKFTAKKIQAEREAQKKRSEELEEQKKVLKQQRPRITVDLEQIKEENDEDSELSNSSREGAIKINQSNISLKKIQNKSSQHQTAAVDLSKTQVSSDKANPGTASLDKRNGHGKRAQTYTQQEVAHDKDIFETESDQDKSDRFNIIRSARDEVRVIDDLIAPKKILLGVSNPSSTKKVLARSTNAEYNQIEDAYQNFVDPKPDADVDEATKAKDKKLAAKSISLKQPKVVQQAEDFDEENSEYVLE